MQLSHAVQAVVTTGSPSTTDAIMVADMTLVSPPRHSDKHVVGDVRSRSPSRTTHAERMEVGMVEVEVTNAGSRSKQQCSVTTPSMALYEDGAVEAVSADNCRCVA
jgi:hypothetical protein